MELQRPYERTKDQKLFDVMKGYTKEQLIKDILSGYHCGDHCSSTFYRTCDRFRCRSGTGTLHCDRCRIFYFLFRRKPCTDWRTNCRICCYHLWHRDTYGTDGLIVATIMAGIILCIMGLCHFGSLIKYIPYTITTGFTCGIAVTLFVGQIKDFLGLDMGAVPSEFIEKLGAYAANITTINPVTVAIGAVALVILILWPK